MGNRSGRKGARAAVAGSTSPVDTPDRVTGAPAGTDPLLQAAEAGWGTTLRFALLRAVDRWPAATFGLLGTGVAAGSLATGTDVLGRIAALLLGG